MFVLPFFLEKRIIPLDRCLHQTVEKWGLHQEGQVFPGKWETAYFFMEVKNVQ